MTEFKWNEKSYTVALLNSERNAMPFNAKSVDLITMFEVIEHFTSDPMFFLTEANRVLKENGMLLISTPNSVSYESIIQGLNGLPPMLFYKFQKGKSSDRHHLEYSPNLLAEIVESAGFDIVSMETHDDKPHIKENHPFMYHELETFMIKTNRSLEHRDRRIYLRARKNHSKSSCRYPSCIYI